MAYHTPDLVYAARAKRAGAKHALRIIYEARRAGLELSTAFALVDQESDFKNVFGHDQGGCFPGKPVTNTRVRLLLNHVANGGVSNGVGLTQLTWPGYIKQAHKMPGGAALPKNQLRVGFTTLAGLVHGHGLRDGLAVYNAGDPNSGQGKAYARSVLSKRNHWHRVLAPHQKPAA